MQWTFRHLRQQQVPEARKSHRWEHFNILHKNTLQQNAHSIWVKRNWKKGRLIHIKFKMNSSSGETNDGDVRVTFNEIRLTITRCRYEQCNEYVKVAIGVRSFLDKDPSTVDLLEQRHLSRDYLASLALFFFLFFFRIFVFNIHTILTNR